MADAPLTFVCLDPRKAKRAAIARTLAPLGALSWRRLPPLGLRGYAESRHRATAAQQTAKRIHTSTLGAAAKRWLLQLQYNGTRAFFAKRTDAVAVAWNGLNGSRRVFMDAARDAGARTLYFELCPLPGRITVDPCGVNFRNGLPRDAQAYADWAKSRTAPADWQDLRHHIRARPPATPTAERTPELPLTDPFIFVPLQVQGDSQLRLFGGAFRKVEAVIAAVAEAAKSLPDGWHVRIKEHPSSPVKFGDLIAASAHSKLVLDNATDTFAQVAAARAVVTVNSSVGLEAMFYEKPVLALGDCFWAIPGVAHHCPSAAALGRVFADPAALAFDPELRGAFLQFLTREYYPDLTRDGPDGALHPQEADKVRDRLSGPDRFGFWACREAA